jgi:1-phosphatidylinositol phosphodiesterase
MIRSHAVSRRLLTTPFLVACGCAFFLGCGEPPSSNDMGDAAAPPPLDDGGGIADAAPNDAADTGVTLNDAASSDAADGGVTLNDAASSDAADASTYTAANWMGAIAGTTSLAALSIPGTHDTGALYEVVAGATKTQDLTVPAQLTAGIRYFDIRTRNVNNKFDIYHLTVYQNLSFDTVLQNIFDFFAANPGETILMSMKQEQPASGSSNTFEQTFDAYTAQHPDRWYLGATIPTLDQVRGKIVLLRRFTATSTPKGIDATVWADNTTFTIDNGSAKLRIQDYYEVTDDDSKWTTITNLFTEANAGGATVLFLNNTSAYQVADGGLENIPSVSNFINPKVASYFTANTLGRYGVVAMDFADATKSSLILKTNFK